jgi:hypothetical protein
MGRQSRQARRAQERRQAQRREAQLKRGEHVSSGGGIARWQVLSGVGVVIIALLVFGGAALGYAPFGGSPTATPVEAPGKTIAGLGCNQMEQVAYHVHQALRIYDHGKFVPISGDVGHNYDHDCLYWLHVHSSDGIIHLESPRHMAPTLGSFFTVARATAPSARILKFDYTPRSDMKVWVNGKPYTGNPMNVVLKQHTDIQIDFGPPFPAYTPFNFASHGV